MLFTVISTYKEMEFLIDNKNTDAAHNHFST